MNYRIAYTNDLNGVNHKYYTQSVTDFIAWLNAHKADADYFSRKAAAAETDDDLYELAYDFSTPVVMVKYLRKPLI